MTSLRALLISCAMGSIAIGCATRGDEAAPSKAQAPAPTPSKPIVLGQFGICHSDCRFQFRELEATSPKVSQTYCRDAEPKCITFEGMLTRAARTQLTAIGKQLAGAQLAEHYGCGACVDGSDNTLVLVHEDGRLTEHSYDSTFEEARVPELNEVHAVLRKIQDALHNCTSNELIEIAAGCTPYDKLDPRPFSRP